MTKLEPDHVILRFAEPLSKSQLKFIARMIEGNEDTLPKLLAEYRAVDNGFGSIVNIEPLSKNG